MKIEFDFIDVNDNLPANGTKVLIRREEIGKTLDGTTVIDINYKEAVYRSNEFLIDGNNSCSYVTHWAENPPNELMSTEFYLICDACKQQAKGKVEQIKANIDKGYDYQRLEKFRAYRISSAFAQEDSTYNTEQKRRELHRSASLETENPPAD
jgi:hypothetical protein